MYMSVWNFVPVGKLLHDQEIFSWSGNTKCFSVFWSGGGCQIGKLSIEKHGWYKFMHEKTRLVQIYAWKNMTGVNLCMKNTIAANLCIKTRLVQIYARKTRLAQIYAWKKVSFQWLSLMQAKIKTFNVRIFF